MATKTVLITGSSTGIGAATAKRMAAAGWQVYAGVRNDDDGERLVAGSDGDVVPVRLDVTERQQIADALARIESDAGRLDGLVNNAGIAVGGPVELLPEERWRWQMEVNFFGVVNTTAAAFPLIDRSNGRLVHIGSIAGRIALAGGAPYAASKFALEGYHGSLRGELWSFDSAVTSSLIEPGEIATDIWDKARAESEAAERLVDEAGRRDRYQRLLDVLRGFQQEGVEKGIPADRVAKAVEHALTARRPKPRYLVGPDAKALGVLGRLPDRVLEPLLNVSYRRYAKAGAKLR